MAGGWTDGFFFLFFSNFRLISSSLSAYGLSATVVSHDDSIQNSALKSINFVRQQQQQETGKWLIANGWVACGDEKWWCNCYIFEFKRKKKCQKKVNKYNKRKK
jgi:hypothetical protein